MDPHKRVFHFKKSYLTSALFLAFFLILVLIYFFAISKVKREALKDSNTPAQSVYPGAPYAADQLIVKYKDAYTIAEIARLKVKLDEIGVISQNKVFDTGDPILSNYYLVNFKKGTDVKQTLEKLTNFSEIEKAGPNYIIETQVAPNDTDYSEQRDLVKIGMPDAWNLAKGSSDIKVAVIDSGIDYNHPDLAGRVINGRDFSTCFKIDIATDDCTEKARDNDSFDDYGHGTHVAGTIGAVTNNNTGIAGINWNVTLVAVKVMGSDGRGYISDVMAGIRYAADNGANVINLSVSAPTPCNHSVGYQRAIDYAVVKGSIVVVAAGNNAADVSGNTPASCASVITVGATDSSDKRWISDATHSSNYGGRVDVSAPGGGILSTIPGGYGLKQGTSMAAPHVAGVAALLLSIKPNLSVTQVRDCLVNYGDSISTDKPIGGRRLNAFKTLNACAGLAPIITQPAQPATPTSVQNQYLISGDIFIDNNLNGQKDLGEPGFPLAVIVAQGQTSLYTISGNSGNFKFANITPGTYKVSTQVASVNISAQVSVDIDHPMWKISFAIPPQLATIAPTVPGQATPIPIFVTPILVTAPIATKNPTPTPIKTWSCHERTGSESRDAIQIGTLVCEENKN